MKANAPVLLVVAVATSVPLAVSTDTVTPASPVPFSSTVPSMLANGTIAPAGAVTVCPSATVICPDRW